MSFMQKIRGTNWIIFAILLINVCLVEYYFSLRTDFHVDEYFTVGHSNSTQGAYLIKGINSISAENNISTFSVPICFSGDYARNYTSVKEGKGFNYHNIVKNLKQSVHPPLYYFLTHTMYSFFPKDFDKWMNFPINIAFFILTFLVVYALARDIFKDEFMSCLTVILFGFCLATLNMAVFIRSYIMQMFIGSVLFYCHYKLLQQDKVRNSTLLQIFLFSYLGFLTHFYFLVFSFMLSAVTCCYFLLRRQRRDLFIYAGGMLFSVVLFFVTYPSAFHLLFYSSRGSQAQGINFYSYDLYYNALSKAVEFIVEYIFAFNSLDLVLFLWIIFFGISIIFLQKKKEKISREVKFLTICCVLFLAAIAVVSPHMGVYYDRYFATIVPVICVLVVYYLNLFLRAIRINDVLIKLILAVVIFLNVIFTNWQERSSYYFPMSENLHTASELMKDRNIILVTYNMVEIISFVGNYPYFKSLCAIAPNDKDGLTEKLNEKKYDYLVLLKANNSSRNKMQRIDYYKDAANSGKLIFERGFHVFSLSKINNK